MSTSAAPVSLSDDQLTAVLAAAAPLQAGDRNLFLQLVAAALQGEREIGDGSLHQVVRSIQREFLRSRPVLDDRATRNQGRYARPGTFTRRRGSRAAAAPR